MFLFIHEAIHLTAGSLVGYLFYKRYREKYFIVTAILASLLIDLDHLVDLSIYSLTSHIGIFSTLAFNFFKASGKVIVPLHSYEMQLIIIVAGYLSKKNNGIYLIVIGTAMLIHTIVDQLTYKPFILEYSLIYRVLNNFSGEAFN